VATREDPGRVTLRVRMSAHDAHYGGNLVDGARLLGLFGDVATELLIRSDGDEGLFAGYSSVEFRAPVHAGDYIEAEGRIVRFGNTSREMEFEARKVIAPRPELSESAAEALPKPTVVCHARGTCVVPKEKQRDAAISARPPQVAGAHPSETGDAVSALLERINAAWTSHNPEATAALLRNAFADDMVIRGPKFEEMARGRHACVASYLDFIRKAEVHAFHASKPIIDRAQESAIAAYGWSIDYTLDGTRYTEEGHDVFAFRLVDGRWIAFWRTMLMGDSETLA